MLDANVYAAATTAFIGGLSLIPVFLTVAAGLMDSFGLGRRGHGLSANGSCSLPLNLWQSVRDGLCRQSGTLRGLRHGQGQNLDHIEPPNTENNAAYNIYKTLSHGFHKGIVNGNVFKNEDDSVFFHNFEDVSALTRVS